MTVWLVCNLVKELYTLVDADRNSPVCWVTKLMELASVFSLYVTTMFTQLEMVIKVSPEPQEQIEPLLTVPVVQVHSFLHHTPAMRTRTAALTILGYSLAGFVVTTIGLATADTGQDLCPAIGDYCEYFTNPRNFYVNTPATLCCLGRLT